MNKYAYRCDGCKRMFWTEHRYAPCPDCGWDKKPVRFGESGPAIIPDIPPGKHYIGPKAQYVGSKAQLREIFKKESDRMGREIRFYEGD